MRKVAVDNFPAGRCHRLPRARLELKRSSDPLPLQLRASLQNWMHLADSGYRAQTPRDLMFHFDIKDGVSATHKGDLTQGRPDKVFRGGPRSGLAQVAEREPGQRMFRRKHRRLLHALAWVDISKSCNIIELQSYDIDGMIDGMDTSKALYAQPAAMEPLLPESARDTFAALTCDILRKAGSLSAQIPSSIVRSRLAGLVREMNSYYSNLIEGHKTLPRDIERALKQDFSQNAAERANQHLNRAHIQVEELMLNRLAEQPELEIHTRRFICWLHAEFYRRLPEELHWSEDRKGKKYKIEPGELRGFEVDVGRHQPPPHSSLPRFLSRFEDVYGNKSMIATDRLVALASAHHRLAWIHPFGDGNGRVTRLYSHACIVRAKVDSLGLWTLSRGLARQRKSYYEHLQAADQTRWNDLDGRGNLSERALSSFCVFLLKTMLDQIEFMSGLFQFENLAQRMDRYLQIERLDLSSRDRERLSRLLRAALVEGQIERGRAGEILGLSGTVARQIVRLALHEELLDSPSEKGPLSLVFSSKTLETYFPKLYQDLLVEGE